ncbi:MAG: putative membrane protein YhhN [Bermanella sp.]|jgi:uncharacterized membrane protein YhhN
MLPVLVCLVSVYLLLVSEKRGLAQAEWLFKPLAAAAFIWAGIAWGGLDSDFGQWVVIGLVLCMAGDVLLIPKGQGPTFLAGMLAFLLGHLAYALAFLRLDFSAAALLASIAGMTLFAYGALRWLWTHLDAQFKAAVVAYTVVISVMVCLSIAVYAAGASWLIPIGAIAFAVSDLSVARNRFVAPGFNNRVWGLPLYFGSQLLIAASVATL